MEQSVELIWTRQSSKAVFVPKTKLPNTTVKSHYPPTKFSYNYDCNWTRARKSSRFFRMEYQFNESNTAERQVWSPIRGARTMSFIWRNPRMHLWKEAGPRKSWKQWTRLTVRPCSSPSIEIRHAGCRGTMENVESSFPPMVHCQSSTDDSCDRHS